MSTTIQVKDETIAMLKLIKKHFNAETYDEAIEKLADNSFRHKSMKGYLGKNERKKIMEGLRDKSDNY